MGEASRRHESDASRWFGPFWLDLANELLWRGEQRVALKPKTFGVLRYLAERPERLITKRELLDALWGDVHVGDAVLKTHLREIRLALGDSVQSPEYIETAHGRGYRFVAKIERQPARLPARGAGPVPTESGVVGRDAELSALEAGLERALRGPLQTVFVVGEAGTGKTTLAAAFLARVRQRGDVWVAQGQCIEQHGAGEPYMPVLEALTRLVEIPVRAASSSCCGGLPRVGWCRCRACCPRPTQQSWLAAPAARRSGCYARWQRRCSRSHHEENAVGDAGDGRRGLASLWCHARSGPVRVSAGTVGTRGLGRAECQAHR